MDDQQQPRPGLLPFGSATFDSSRGRRVEVSRVEGLVLEAIHDPRFVDPENTLADRSAALVP
jgi:hypothetical protein